MRKIFLILMFFVPLFGLGQVEESFADNDINLNPTWYGNVSSFSVENQKLRSAKAEINSKFYLCTSSALLKNTEWSINVDLPFNPSSANFVDVYLTASDSNLLSTTLSGFFIRIGNTKDEICFYKKINGTNTLLLDGTDGLLNKSTNNIKLKVACDNNYKWSVNYDATGVKEKLGPVSDSSITSSSWFGLSIYQSTASFFQKHYFDDIKVSGIVKDTTPPALVSQSFVGNKAFTVTFDEPLDSSWVRSKSNIELYDRLGRSLAIDSVLFFSPGGEKIEVILKDNISTSGLYVFIAKIVKDRNGNTIQKQLNGEIAYFVPAVAKYKDIVFSEFLIDPVPSAGLPEKEFIEIFNNSDKTIDLAGFTLSDPSTSSKLPSYLFLPKSYLIICKNTDLPDFASFGNTLALANIPSLNNTEDDIKLLNPHSELIDRVNYKQTWYNNTSKDDGGYSLEIIDPNNICLGKNNWSASNSMTGGTPGSVNSVFQTIKDSLLPTIRDISVSNEYSIRIIFNEILDSASYVIPNFIFQPVLSINKLNWQKDSLEQLAITFDTPLSKNIEYQVKMMKVKDCPGNSTELSTTFVTADIAQKGDLLLNELLFNPYPYGADFVEIYNASDRIIDLKGWKFANLKNDTAANKITLSTSFLLRPKQYLAFTVNKQNILNTYIKSQAERIIEVKTLPTFYDDQGTAFLLSPKDEIMDRLDYNQTMHSPFINNKQGVSLEKINPNLATADPSSWTSASKEAGYATPGYVNSQNLTLTVLEDIVEITPTLITPNQDGDNDLMIIRLKTDKPGSLRNIQIFDITGRTVKHLERNSYASTATSIQWDGSDDSNKLVPMGHYIIWIEIADSEGNIKHLKKKVVVGDRF